MRESSGDPDPGSRAGAARRPTADPSARGFTSAAAVAGALASGIVLFGASVSGSWHGPVPKAPEPPAVRTSEAPIYGLFLVPDSFLRGDSLSNVLERNGFSAREIADITEALTPVSEVRRLRAGQSVWLHRNERGVPSRIELPIEDFRRVSVVRSANGWTARETEGVRFKHRETVQGILTTSLDEAVHRAGERADLAMLIAQVLEHDVDFHRDPRRGDTFSLVVDKLYDAEGVWKGYGDLHAVRYRNAGRAITAFRFELPSGASGYYDHEGNSVQRSFLTSPVAYTRISGVFTSRRFHPVHRVYRPHYGVDYAAPRGTPVRATADGVVADAGRRGPNGNMVTLRHAGGYVTKYLHLQRIAPEARTGHSVRQREIIGYVGSTGVSTGPHLDYRMSRYGRPLNPRTHILPPGPPISPEYRAAFDAWRNGMLAALDSPAPRPRPSTALRTLDASGGGS